MANNRIAVTIDVSANAAKAKSEISGLSNLMKNLNIGNGSQKQMENIESTIVQLVTKFEQLDGQDLDLQGLKQADKDAQTLVKEFNKLVAIRDNLSSKQGIELLPKSTQTGLSNIKKELESYSEYYEKTKVAMRSLQAYGQSNEGKTDFNINSKGLGELRKQLTGIGVDLTYLSKGENSLQGLKDKINQLRTDRLEKIRQSFSELSGIPLDKIGNNFSKLKQQAEAFGDEKIRQAVQDYEALDNTVEDLSPHIKEIAKTSQQKLFEGQELDKRRQEIDNLTRSLESFFGIQNMINLFKRGVREAISVVQELDKAMAATAVVTDFTVNDMWEQLPMYQEMANKLGVTIKDVYEASTLYYQQGLNQKQVMEVTNQTLQMARIAGIGAAEATDMMTAALRGFNMEVNEANAQRVNDIFSELAAITASDTKELGTALEKTASIANSAGMSIEVTAALLAQAIEATREAPENIGTAMKTIIARFQELKKNPLTLSEVDGEMVDFNKVDTALKTIGVDLVESTDNFRNLDGVLLEISAKWDGLTQTQRRYIATIVAGSRQQSRFIAMMGDNARLTELVSHAYDSAGAAARQYEKTQASLETAFNRVKNAWDVFLMGIANNKLIKAAATLIENFVKVLDKVFSILGKLPGPLGDVTQSIAQLVATVAGLKGAGMLLKGVMSGFTNMWFGKGAGGKLSNNLVAGISQVFTRQGKKESQIQKIANSLKKDPQFADASDSIIRQAAEEQYKHNKAEPSKFWKSMVKDATGPIDAFRRLGTAASTAFKNVRVAGGGIGNMMKALGSGLGGLAGAIGPGGWIAIAIAGITTLIAIIRKFHKTAKEKIEARDNLFQGFNESLEDIQKNVDSVKDLEGQFKSLAEGVDENGKNIGLTAEEYSKYNDIVNQLVKISPEIVKGYTKEGQAIVDKNTAIEKSIELLEKEKEAEEAEFFSPKNIKTALEGYEGDKQELSVQIFAAGGNVASIFGDVDLTDVEKNLDTNVEELQNRINDLELDLGEDGGFLTKAARKDKEEALEEMRSGLQELESYRAAADKIYAQETNYLLQYADFLDITKALEPGQQSTYASVLKEMVANNEITEGTAILKLNEALNITNDLETDVDGYTEAIERAEEAKKKFDESTKTNKDIQEFNKTIAETTKELDDMADAQEGVGENGDKYARAIRDQSEALRDYKKAVISVEAALNPLGTAYSRALSNAKDLKEYLEGDNIHTASLTMAENLDTVLDSEVDSDGNIKWGVHESGRGSAQYWKVAEATLGKDYLRGVNYDINTVNPRMHEMQKMLEGSQEGVDLFFKKITESAPKLLKKGFKGNNAVEFLRDLTQKGTREDIEKFATAVGMSEDALMAMTSKARQFADIGMFNPDMLRQAYGEQEEGVATVGDITKKGEGFVLLSSEQLEEDFRANGYNPQQWSDYQAKAQAAGVYGFEDAEDFTKVYGKALKEQNIGQQSLLQALETANATGQFDKDELKTLGQTWIDSAPEWLKIPEGGFAEGELDSLVEGITSNDEVLEPVDAIKGYSERIATAVEALAQKEGVYTEENQKNIEGDLTVSNHQLEDLDVSKYEGDELEGIREKLLESAEKNKTTRAKLDEIYDKADDETKKRLDKTKELLADNDDLLDKKIEAINKKLNIDETGEESVEKNKKKEEKDKKAKDASMQEGGGSNEELNRMASSEFDSDEVATLDVDDTDFWDKFHAIQEALEKYKQMQASATVDANNKPAIQAVNAAISKLLTIDGKKTVTNLLANDSSAVRGINNVISGVKKVPIGKEIVLNATANVGSAMAAALLKMSGVAGGINTTIRLGKTYYENGSSGGGLTSVNGGDNLQKGNVGGGGGSGGGGGGGGGGGSKEKADTPYSKDLSKIHNQLQRILYYNRLQEIAEAKYQSLITSHSTNPIQTLSKQIREERDAILSTINIQKGILKDEKKYTQTIISEINKDLKAAGGGSNIGKYLTIDTDRRMVQVTTAGLQATGEIKNAISAGQKLLEEWFSDVFDAEKGIYENTTQLNELRNTINQATGSFLDDLKNGIVDFRQDAIDRLSQINDTIDESNQKILDKTKESIDLQRQNRENDKKKQDLEDKRTRLSLLMQDTQGGHQVEIANLQKELAEGTQEFQDTLVDQKLDQITKANEEAKEQRERQINILQKQLDWSVDTGKIWDEIYKLWQNSMDSGSFDMSSTAAKYWLYGKDNAQQNLHNRKINWAELQKNSDDAVTGGVYSGHIMPGNTKSAGHYGSLTEMANAPELSGVEYGSTVTLSWDGKTVKGKIVKGNGGKAVIEAKNPTTGLTYKLNDWDVNKYGQDSETWVVNTGATDYRNQTNQLAFEQLKKSGGQLTFTDASGKTQTGTVMPDGSVKISKGAEFWTYTGLVADYSGNWSTKTKPQYQNFKDVQTVYDKIALAGYANTDWRDPKNPGNLWPEKIEKIIGAGNYKSRFLSRYNELKKNGTLEAWKKAGVEQWTYEILKDVMKNGKFIQYKTGGIADFTGPAWLDGTKSKPEMVLNQKDTQNFLQLKDILASIMKYNGLKSDSISNMNNSNSNYEININVDHLNSDYDVDKVAARVTKLITKSAAYRNPVKVTNYR